MTKGGSWAGSKPSGGHTRRGHRDMRRYAGFTPFFVPMRTVEDNVLQGSPLPLRNGRKYHQLGKQSGH
eukprot:6189541-Amphidinium_carterae.1